MFTSFERRKMFSKKRHSPRRQGSDQLPVDDLRAVASLSRMFWCVGSMCIAALCNCLVFCFKFSISRCIFRREVRSIRLWPDGLSITAFSDGFIFEKNLEYTHAPGLQSRNFLCRLPRIFHEVAICTKKSVTTAQKE